MKNCFWILPLIIALEACTSPPKNPWKEIARPSEGPPESIGNYNNGCLKGAVSLYPDGPGYQVMRISRRRFYGHPALIQMIENLALEVRKKKLGAILVGDLSQPRGGLNVGGHASHQNGLDVDIWFSQSDHDRLNLDEREGLSAQSMVEKKEMTLNSELWSPAKMKILKLAAKQPSVERIFVNPVIKRELCKKSPKAAWIAKIRPWWGHDDHFHVRLKCPEDSTACNEGNTTPIAGSGCDETLDWWFSEEATKKVSEPTKPSEKPKLPEACEKLLKEM